MVGPPFRRVSRGTSNSFQANQSREGVMQAIHKCMAGCAEECEYDNLDIKVSTATFPAPTKLQAFATYLSRAYANAGLNFTEDTTRQLIFFEMFYELKEIRVIERMTRTTIAELVSNIGGALGVWTGLSILSVYQCAVYVVKGLGDLKARNP